MQRKYVKEQAEGRTGHNPEEVLGTGARNLIKFKPIVMRSKNNNYNRRAGKKLSRMMNKGRHKLGTVQIKGAPTTDGDGDNPLGESLAKAIRGKYKDDPTKLRNTRKVTIDRKAQGEQGGLRALSKKNFKDKTKRDKRQKLDVCGF